MLLDLSSNVNLYICSYGCSYTSIFLFTETKNNKDSSAHDYQTTVTVDNTFYDETKTVITPSAKVNN